MALLIINALIDVAQKRVAAVHLLPIHSAPLFFFVLSRYALSFFPCGLFFAVDVSVACSSTRWIKELLRSVTSNCT